MENGMRRRDFTLKSLPALVFVVFCTVWAPLFGWSSGEPAPEASSEIHGASWKVGKQGVEITMRVVPAEDDRSEAGELFEGADAHMEFSILDSATGSPLSGLQVAAWVDPQIAKGDVRQKEGGVVACQDKIKWFLQGSLALQPAVNLTTYYLLVLNQQPNISVIDPQVGFHTSKLITTIPLKSPGEDWALAGDGKRLFVSMPRAGQVAVADTTTWKVIENMEVGPNPVAVVLQPDERYVWVGQDTEPGTPGAVTILEPETLRIAGRLEVGSGHQEIAFSSDSRLAFVSSSQSGTVTVINSRSLQQEAQLATGRNPAALAYSDLADALYVAHDSEDGIVVVDAKTLKIVGRIAAHPGLTALRFSPGGRWGFALNGQEDQVSIVDASDNRIAHTVSVEKEPDQVSFTRAFAYIRSARSEQLNMIQLSQLGKEENLPVSRIPVGKSPPRVQPGRSMSRAIAPTPEGDTVVVVNSADKILYYHMEGMLAPMGSFQNYGFTPRGVMVVDRSFKEVAPGRYRATFKLPGEGRYDVAFLLEFPRVDHCFQLTVSSDPRVPRARGAKVRMELLSGGSEMDAGGLHAVRFRLLDARTGEPLTGLGDFRALYFPTAENWQAYAGADHVGDGVYRLEIEAPRPGYYQVFFECPSLKMTFKDLPVLTLRAVQR